MASPVVIRSFLNPGDAYFAQLILEDAGIPVFLYDENASGSTISYTYALGGIKIAVPDTFTDRALEILDADFKESKLHDNIDVTDKTCPKCGSERIFHKTGHTSFSEIVLYILAGIFLQSKKSTKYQCRDCKHSWRNY